MIHEGTHGIQGMDLLGRKVLMQGGRALELLTQRMQATGSAAESLAGLAPFANQLGGSWAHVLAATRAAWSTGDPQQALANAVPYMQAFGHAVLAWIWLDVSVAALRSDPAGAAPGTIGILGATRYFFHFELPKTGAWLHVVETRDMTCAQLPEEAF